MNRKMRYLLILAAVAIFASILPATSAAAAGISASPTYGDFDTTYTFKADGFQPNEIVDTWIGLPNLSAVSTGVQRASASGTVTWSFKPLPSYGGGEYIAVARGRASGEFATKFNVVAPPNNNTGGNNNNNNNNQPQPAPVIPASERTVQFNASGYLGGETVATWYQAPNGTVTAYQNFTADAWGNLSFPFTVGSSWMYGGYQVVGYGLKSGNTQYIQFAFFGRVSGGESSKPVTKPAPYYDFAASGFRAGEMVSLWIGLPNGTTQALTNTTADSKGNVYFRVNIIPGWPYGGYVVAAYGWQSRVTQWRQFAYFGQVS
jgi:hypothetical protein